MCLLHVELAQVDAHLCLLLNFSSTWSMIGLIWLIQIVHYPLFTRVGAEGFKKYAEDHQRLISYLVLPLMLVELGTAVILWKTRPAEISQGPVTAGIFLLLVIWGSTFLIQVPQHRRLLTGYDADVCRHLVRWNWIRTVAWSARGLLSGWMVWLVMTSGSAT